VTLGILALMGSGETAPSMTKVHRQILKPLSDVRAISLDTPYGFQANVPQMTEKIVDYFATSLRVDVKPVSFLNFADSSDVARALFRQEVQGANYVFSGPGSPSYAVHQWRPVGLGEDLKSILRSGGVVCFASAAALTLGMLTVPVYEIYKVGAKVHWLEGMDVLSLTGIEAAIIPHFDNAEGGNYDTRYCYLGRDRLEELERQLPDGVGVLGVDEHTAALIDLERQTLSVAGKGNVYWRRDGDELVFATGSTIDLVTIRSFEPMSLSEHPVAIDEPTGVDELVARASEGGEVGAHAVATLARMASTGGEGYIDPSSLVDGLLELRETARSTKDFQLADRIRDLLVDANIEVMDSPDGTTWQIN
jgi:hypothetical protein